MSGATGATGTAAEAFAELLRGLKERSGLSYGALAKRLHMSTSSLHRYCNGSAVPPDYAPAERLARVCRATPEELVELHRRWILADAARGRKAAGPEEPAPAATPDDSPPEPSPVDAEPVEPAPAAEPAEPAEPASAAEPGGSEPVSDEPVVGGTAPSAPSPSHRRRTALIASVATAAVLGALVLAVNLPSSGDDAESRWAGDVTVPTTAPATTVRADEKRPSASASSPSSPAPSRSAKPGEPSARASKPAARGDDGADADERARTGGVPLNVATRPYTYEDPCSQHFLVDAEPEQVGPPASEQDAPRWAAANGAVSSGEQRIALTVQGTGKDTVVLEALHLRVVAKGAPLAWNDYSMGVGCGGGVGTKSFDADLDDGSPTVTVKNGQRDFPYKVSESDPEVFYLTARTKAHDVRWDLALTWSSGDRRGTVHIDNNGTPFRTSANAGRPGYDYPLGGSEWIERPE
ncbi:putative membrane protein [Streptomyces himastatinicus ATCC 53653]|uniref:Putative membrane protein n=1 Tax=Streptomyces himastatinicus ATCC 53653 TaxID=457427 RepID=D9WPR5_9ACTN|nr:helix-turn-helix transcriptional regulator [Streptomyces himastatinicus]EFL23919.1 putative membrane protein [Streptomyces himastatinicus ATCC 53653]